MAVTHRIGTIDRRGAYVQIELRHTPKGTELGIIGFTRQRADADWHHGGQCIDTIARVTRFAPGWDAARRDELVQIWRRWHLNGMRAECEHQRALGWTWVTHPTEPCPECGYRLGSAWIFEELPPEVIRWATDLGATPVGACFHPNGVPSYFPEHCAHTQGA